MSLNCGIVGLPNVGKSTLFSALTSSNVEIANYPFCTINPNVGIVELEDERLDNIKKYIKPKKVVKTVVEFVDIAGLVKGASNNEGLGNKFLANIREVSLILHVVRCFQDSNIIHVAGEINPLNDIETINTELCIADLESVLRAISKQEKYIKSQDKALRERANFSLPILKKLKEHLNEGISAIKVELNEDERIFVDSLNLLTMKRVIYLCNVDESTLLNEVSNKYLDIVKNHAKNEGNDFVIVSAKLESELSQISSKEEREEFIQSLGMKESSLSKLVKKAYHNLGLRTYFTAGEEELRTWTFKEGIKAPQAAGIIHSDFERGFIKAEVYHYEDLLKYKSVANIKNNGKLRIEGRDYVVRDGDIMFFRFNL